MNGGLFGVVFGSLKWNLEKEKFGMYNQKCDIGLWSQTRIGM